MDISTDKQDQVDSLQSPPCSPLAPPFSPIITEETKYDKQIMAISVPIKQITMHSQLPPAVSELLPVNYTYILETFTQLDSHHVAFDTKFCVNIKTEIEAKQWISEFEHSTDTTYRITKGTKTLGKRILYKTVRHCQHKRKKSNKLPKKDRAKTGKIYSVNIPPFFSKLAKRTFATLAVGKSKEMHLEFYADLRDDSQSPPSNYSVADDDVKYMQNSEEKHIMDTCSD